MLILALVRLVINSKDCFVPMQEIALSIIGRNYVYDALQRLTNENWEIKEQLRLMCEVLNLLVEETKRRDKENRSFQKAVLETLQKRNVMSSMHRLKVAADNKCSSVKPNLDNTGSKSGVYTIRGFGYPS